MTPTHHPQAPTPTATPRQQAKAALAQYENKPCAGEDTSTWSRDDFDYMRAARHDHAAKSASRLAEVLRAVLAVEITDSQITAAQNAYHEYCFGPEARLTDRQRGIDRQAWRVALQAAREASA